MTGVIYARYSSDNQREESIEGQLRECKVFAEKNGIRCSTMPPKKVRLTRSPKFRDLLFGTAVTSESISAAAK